MLTLSCPKLPLSCPYVDPMFAYVGLGNALPHSSDRKGGGGDGVTTGWGGGGEGVTTGGSAAGAARLYNLRLPTEGLRQGHGARGRRPDLKADAGQPGAGRRGAMLALCSPLLDLSRPYVSRMLPQVSSMSPMLAHVGPMLALCWPNLALSCPYVGPMFAYVTPILPLC